MLRLLLGKQFSLPNMNKDYHSILVKTISTELDELFIPSLCRELRSDGKASTAWFEGYMTWRETDRMTQLDSEKNLLSGKVTVPMAELLDKTQMILYRW